MNGLTITNLTRKCLLITFRKIMELYFADKVINNKKNSGLARRF